MQKNVLIGLCLCTISGCFPLEIDVNEKGELLIYRQEGFFVFDPATKKTTPISGPGTRVPLFARFRPGGKQVLTVVNDEETGDHFELIALSDGTKKQVYEAFNCCYTRFSPDGRLLALTRMGKREWQKPNDDTTYVQDVCELVVLDLETGREKKFVEQQPHAFFRWFSDSKRILAVFLDHKNDDGKYGHLSEIDIDNGRIKKIACVAGHDQIYIDLAPNNKAALVSALAVAPINHMPTIKRDDHLPHMIFAVDIEKGTVHNWKQPSEFAIFSPNGQSILMSVQKETENMYHSLIVTDANGTNAKPIVDYRPPSSAYLDLASEAVSVPGWRDNQTIFYLDSHATFGKNRQAPWLKTVAIDGQGVTTLQPYIDVAVLEAEPGLANKRRPATSNAPAPLKRGIIIIDGK